MTDKAIGEHQLSTSYSGKCTTALLSQMWLYYCMQMQRSVQQIHVSVWWPTVQKTPPPAPPVSLCGSSLHLRLGQQSLPKDYFGKDCPSPPNTVALAAAEADIVFIYSTQHCGEESIETVVTADPSQRIRPMFSCERSRWNGNNRSLREGRVCNESEIQLLQQFNVITFSTG